MFFVKNWKPILLVTFVIISEVIIKIYPEAHHVTANYVITWGDMLYYFFAQVGYISLLPSLFLYWSCKNIDSKGIYLGLVVWNVLEVFQEINVLFKLGFDFLNKSDSELSDIYQIIFIIFTVIFIHYGYKKCHTYSQS